MRYLIDETINQLFLDEYEFIDVFGYQDSGQWVVDKRTLDSIDSSGDTDLSINDFCLEKYAQTRSQFFDPKLDSSFQNFLLQETKAEEGFKLYKKIIGDINDGGGFSSIDEGRMAYKAYLVPVRNYLKDGFPEFAYREISLVIAPTGLFSDEQILKYKLWIKDLGLKYGTPEGFFILLDTKLEGEV